MDNCGNAENKKNTIKIFTLVFPLVRIIKVNPKTHETPTHTRLSLHQERARACVLFTVRAGAATP